MSGKSYIDVGANEHEVNAGVLSIGTTAKSHARVDLRRPGTHNVVAGG